MDEDEICEWQEATGLLCGGDPGGVTPKLLAEHQGMASDVIVAAQRFVESANSLDGLAAKLIDLRDKLQVYLQRWPEGM